MKTIKQTVIAMGILSVATSTLMSGPVITVQIPVPAPVITVQPAVPETYAWDGQEYVGVVGTQYYYLGPSKVWLPLDAPHLKRFHDWEKVHADWRTHATRNQLYRRDAQGHDVPFHDDHSHDHDHDH
jgi:hypothetical protein